MSFATFYPPRTVLTSGRILFILIVQYMSAGKIFYYLNAALIAGVSLGSFLYGLEIWVLFFIVFALFIILYVWKRKVFFASACFFIAFAGLLFVRHAVVNYENLHVQTISQTPQIFLGHITDISIKKSQLLIRIKTPSGTIRFSTYEHGIREGDKIQIRCNAFSESFELAIVATHKQIAFCSDAEILTRESNKQSGLPYIRNALSIILFKALPSPESDLLAGMLLGKQSNFSDDLDQVLQRTGTTHVVVLSGFNITIFAFVINSLFRRTGLGLKSSTIASLIVIWLFIFLVGFSAPVVRAGILASFMLLARVRGRPSSSIALLLLSASIMLFENPLLLRWSLSFQLSFLATIGVLYQDVLSPRFLFISTRFGIRENLQTTFAATIMTAPLIALSFGGVSLVSLFTNMVVLPFVPLVMALGVPVLIAGFLHQSIALILGMFPFIFLRFITSFLTWFSGLPFAYIQNFHISFLVIMPWYGVFGFIAFRRSKKQQDTHFLKQHLRPISMRVWLSLAVAVIPVSVVMLRYPFIQVPEIHFFDVGQGDATHLRLPNGFDMLIDGGPDATILSRLGRTMPYIDRSIDVLVLTHPHADHVAGLTAVLQKYWIDEIWINGVVYDSPVYEEFLHMARKKNIFIRTVSASYEVLVDDPFHTDIRVVAAGSIEKATDLNQTSIVLLIASANHRALVTGDAGIPVERRLVKEDVDTLKADILKVGHHGSQNASSESFLRVVDPDFAVVSVGADNIYKLPNKTTINRFNTLGIPVFRTDMCGTVSVPLKEGQTLSPRAHCAP